MNNERQWYLRLIRCQETFFKISFFFFVWVLYYSMFHTLLSNIRVYFDVPCTTNSVIMIWRKIFNHLFYVLLMQGENAINKKMLLTDVNGRVSRLIWKTRRKKNGKKRKTYGMIEAFDIFWIKILLNENVKMWLN